jgi:hypothetical protein
MSSGENITMNMIGAVRDSRCSQLQKIDHAKAEVKGHGDRCVIFTQIVPWLFSVGSDVIFLASNENSFSLPRESDVLKQKMQRVFLNCRAGTILCNLNNAHNFALIPSINFSPHRASHRTKPVRPRAHKKQ